MPAAELPEFQRALYLRQMFAQVGFQAREIQNLVRRLARGFQADGDSETSSLDLELLRPRGDERIAVLLVTSDRGLCGAYNSNILATYEEFRAELPRSEIATYVIGRKGVEYCERRYEVTGIYDDPPLEKMQYGDTVAITYLGDTVTVYPAAVTS